MTERGAVTLSLSMLLISDNMSARVSSPVTSYTGSPWGISKKGKRARRQEGVGGGVSVKRARRQEGGGVREAVKGKERNEK